MIANTNDGSRTAPYLRIDINAANYSDLPAWTTCPTGDVESVCRAVKAAGFAGIQGGDINVCRSLGLGCTSGGRVNKPEEADRIASQHKEKGYDCSTLHVAWGLESDDQASRLFEAILTASEKHHYPLYIETHRATLTQDPYRTVKFVEKFPELKFNGDFSHWYTGLEMVYGNFNEKLDYLKPVFDRVRFIHARIGNPGSMQVDVGDGTDEKAHPYVGHFKEMWTRSMMGFLKSAKPGDFISFTPELLGPNIYYARLLKQQDGQLIEESDRWQQAIVYQKLALDSFAEAKRRLASA